MSAENIVSFPRIVAPAAKKKSKNRKNQYADGRYCSRLTITRPDGTKYQKPFYGNTATEAREKKNAYKRKLGKVTDSAMLEMTVHELIALFLPSVKGKSNSNDAMYVRMCDRIASRIGDMRVQDVRKMHITPIMDELKGQSKSQLSKARMVIKSLFAYASENDLTDKDPTLSLKAEGGTYTGHRALEEWEQSLILNHWQEHRGIWWMMLFMLTGMRKGEAIASLYDDFANGWLNISKSAERKSNRFIIKKGVKTDAGIRSVPIFGFLQKALEAKASFPEAHLVTPDNDGTLITPAGFKRGWESAMLRLEKIANGIDPSKQPRKKSEKWITLKWTPHDLRYTYATLLYDAGVDEKTAQTWLGHSDPRMTRDLYTQLSDRRKKQSETAARTYFDSIETLIGENKKHQKSIKTEQSTE